MGVYCLGVVQPVVSECSSSEEEKILKFLIAVDYLESAKCFFCFFWSRFNVLPHDILDAVRHLRDCYHRLSHQLTIIINKIGL